MTVVGLMCLNHTLEYVRPEIKIDLTSLAPKITNISSEIASFTGFHSSCHFFILPTIVTEHRFCCMAALMLVCEEERERLNKSTKH